MRFVVTVATEIIDLQSDTREKIWKKISRTDLTNRCMSTTPDLQPNNADLATDFDNGRWIKDWL